MTQQMACECGLMLLHCCRGDIALSCATTERQSYTAMAVLLTMLCFAEGATLRSNALLVHFGKLALHCLRMTS